MMVGVVEKCLDMPASREVAVLEEGAESLRRLVSAGMGVEAIDYWGSKRNKGIEGWWG